MGEAVENYSEASLKLYGNVQKNILDVVSFFSVELQNADNFYVKRLQQIHVEQQQNVVPLLKQVL